MIYSEFQGKKLSALGFGAMRLPKHEDGTIDEQTVAEQVRYAIDHGVNYFDTAYFYHSGESESVMGRVLKEYPRDSYYLASKYPGHQVDPKVTNPAEIFEDQLRKCQVEYFDFYLLHNVNEMSVEAYLDPKWGIVEYLKEQKRLGRIRHLGFSTHAAMPCLKRFLEVWGEDMEFCQIQLNWLDWTLQDGKGKYELLTERGIPVWTMESIRGGRLAKLSEDQEAALKCRRPNESAASWGFRYLQSLPNVKMILSGMTRMEDLKDNIRTFSEGEPLRSEEIALLMEMAEQMKDSLPCTACRYCCDGCPQGLDIPMLLEAYNELRFALSPVVRGRLDLLPAEQRPEACIGCGKCMKICPQNIDIPAAMRDLVEKLAQCPL
jgi:predicted aldo/keto reductase-like oxidoreductase